MEPSEVYNKLDPCADFGFKSAFARSVAINSKYKENQEQQNKCGEQQIQDGATINCTTNNVEVIRLRKECKNLVDENRRLSISGSGLNVSSSLPNIPVEAYVLQSQVNTLQWQLQQKEASREMYRALMQQMVSFLERAHRSLDLLQERLGPTAGGSGSSGTGTIGRRPVPRSRSVHHVAAAPPPVLRAHSTAQIQRAESSYSAFKDFTWRRPKCPTPTADEIPPEKLSQEALRLLRTAQSLLSTQEPDLIHQPSNDVQPLVQPPEEDSGPAESPEPSTDEEFLHQLAREFPSRPNNTPTITTQLISPVNHEISHQISTAFNRKLSLQRHSLSSKNSSLRNSVAEEGDYCLMAPSLLTSGLESAFAGGKSHQRTMSISSNHSSLMTQTTPLTRINNDNKYTIEKDKYISKEKSTSPPMGSVSSAEDESGFSSMSSFQEIGVPLVNSTIIGDKNNQSNFLNSMLVNDSMEKSVLAEKKIGNKSFWLHQNIGLPEPANGIPIHRRWSSNPVETTQKEPLKVLWV